MLVMNDVQDAEVSYKSVRHWFEHHRQREILAESQVQTQKITRIRKTHAARLAELLSGRTMVLHALDVIIPVLMLDYIARLIYMVWCLLTNTSKALPPELAESCDKTTRGNNCQ